MIGANSAFIAAAINADCALIGAKSGFSTAVENARNRPNVIGAKSGFATMVANARNPPNT
jgi:hypothetical protein